MDKVSAEITVYFEEPFWVGVYQRVEDGQLTACKLVFGAEPKDYEVLETFQKNWRQLRFSPPVHNASTTQPRINPKRLQRSIQRQVESTGIGTKAQQALQLQREEQKMIHQVLTKEQKELEKKQKFLHRQEKKKQKHNGH